ncbi:MAG: NAD(P)-dependent oxidoreductase [Pseudomonadota bacterium]
MEIGIIGCGNMGGGMASHLAASGHDVRCHDASPETRHRLSHHGLAVEEDIGRLAEQSNLVLLSLPNAAAVEAVMDAIHDRMHSGSIVVDTSTSDPVVTTRLTSRAERYAFLDAPVSGGPAAACSGTMTMLIGGDADALDRARPVLDVLASKIVHVGGPGAGHAAKIANNMLCAANLVLVAEAVRLGEAAGISGGDLLEGVNAGSGRSGVSEVNFPKWILSETFDSGFTMGLMRKDVRLAQSLAKRLDVPMKAFETVAAIWSASAEKLDDNADFNAITKLAGQKP